MNVQRFYQITVVNKQEFDSHFNLSFGWELNNPVWLNSTLDGTPLHLTVTKEEFDSVKIGDIFTVQITSR